MIKDLSESNYVEYYSLLKKLTILHRKFKFGRTPQIPLNFSESIAMYLCKLTKIEGRTFDAIDVEGNNIEIKATTSESGTTSINPNSKFDFLYWLFFNFDNDTITIKKGNYKKNKKILSKKIEADEKRSNISLCKYLKNESIIACFEINVKSNEIEKIKEAKCKN